MACTPVYTSTIWAKIAQTAVKIRLWKQLHHSVTAREAGEDWA